VTSTAPPHIVVICGSTRFTREMKEIDRELTWLGNAVFAPTRCNLKQDDPLWADPADKAAGIARLDALHRDLIRIANEVLVVNPGGYIGDSTRGEIAYALSLGKTVRYTHPQIDPGLITCTRCGDTDGPFAGAPQQPLCEACCRPAGAA
jgi:hypothetical protein